MPLTQVPSDLLADSAVTTAKIASGAVATADLADGSVTTAKLVDANVTTAKLVDASVTTVKIADSNVTTVKIADSNVTTAKLADGAVTPAKLSQSLTAATAQASTSGTSIDFTGIPSWAKRVTVMLSAVSTSSTGNPLIQLGTSSGYETSGYVGVAMTTGGGGSAQVGLSSGFNVYDNAPAASNSWSGSLILTNVSGNTWAAQGIFGESSTAIPAVIGGGKSLSGTLDRVRVFTTTGTDTFDAGTINIMYE